MSFSSDVKNSLCEVTTSGCCRLAECYGILLFNRAFSYKEITLLTENQKSAERCARLIKSAFSVTAKREQSQALNGMYKTTVDNEADCKRMMTGFGYNPNDLIRRINSDLLTRDCCAAAFIRGAFLACGSISDPQKGYHAEFTISDYLLADEFYQFLRKRGLSPKKSLRERNNVIYFNESSSLEDLLTMIGASNYTLELMEIKIYKDFRNKINRINNCETANISKTVDAAIAQKNAINKLIDAGVFEGLPEPLKKVAKLRLDNPDASLATLIQLSDESLTRSGLNHRLQKLVSMADNL